MMWGGIINNRIEATCQLGKETPEKDLCLEYMAMSLMFLNRYAEALEYLQKLEEQLKKEGKENQRLNLLLGFCYLKTGEIKKSDGCFDKALAVIHPLIQTKPDITNPDLSYAITDRYWKFPYFILTSIYAVRGEKKNALDNLRFLREKFPASDLQVVFLLKYWPMFDNIRNEPRFQDYLQAAESHYLKEHARVEELLRKEEIIM